ncbi:ATP-binding cassette domain-containing protein [Candidiatus Paracoxiella cheracis]|uniref:ATP-binding cassette domain-containing protein n=1 Tax=Candidiatus Paracoxiella cheracis TaxID=3405120 RepID=UPI003BF548E3
MFRNVILSGVNSAISDFVTIATGMLVLGFGAVRIIDGTLSVGAMLAIMILSWRILAPIKTVFNMYPRVIQMGNSLRQITKLMRIKSEVKSTDLGRSRLFGLRGEITFRQVSLRYPNAYQPALIGVDFNVKPGEQVAITGRNGSGKSSIFKLLLRMCQQQMGSVLIDQQDIRQFNEIELRSVIGYLPQVPELFYGTIADNIRLSSPGATDEDVEKVAARVGILDTIRTLPKGIHAHIRDFSTEKLSVGFQRSLCLARALLKQAPILLLDEPTSGLDEKANENLLHILENLRGKITVLIVTYRPSYMKLMDKVLVLDDGRLILQGPPNQVMPEIIKEIV